MRFLMMKTKLMISEPADYRLHPLSLIFNLVDIFRRFLIPGIIVLLFNRGEQVEFWLMLFAVPAFVVALVKYLSLHFRLTDVDLIIRSGILKRVERRIPFVKIQNIDTKQSPLHRLFGVADLVIQTAGGVEPEAELRVLSNDFVKQFQKIVSIRRSNQLNEFQESQTCETEHPQLAEETNSTLIRGCSLSDLIILGIISNRGIIAISLIYGILWQFDLIPMDLGISIALKSIFAVADNSAITTVILFASLIIMTVVGTLGLSIIWNIIRLHHFSLSVNGQEFNTTYGFFTQHSAVIPIDKIQRIDMSESLLHRIFTSISIRVRTAGNYSRNENETDSNWLMPLLPKEQLSFFLHSILPHGEWDSLQWQAVEAKGKTRLFKKSLFFIALMFLYLFWKYGLIASLVVLPLIPLAAVRAHFKIKNMHFALTSNYTLFRTGWIFRSWHIVPYNKIQSVYLTESPFDRRYSMSRLMIDTAHGDHAFLIPFLSRKTASETSLFIYSKAKNISFKW